MIGALRGINSFHLCYHTVLNDNTGVIRRKSVNMLDLIGKKIFQGTDLCVTLRFCIVGEDKVCGKRKNDLTKFEPGFYITVAGFIIYGVLVGA